MTRPWFALAVLGVMALPVPRVEAAGLSAEQCKELSDKMAALDSAGVKTIVEKGPAATRATLSREQREQVRVYLDTLGQLRFRCPNAAPFVTLKPEPPDDPNEANAAVAPIEAGAPGITLPAGVAAAVIAPAAPKKSTPAKEAKAAEPTKAPAKPKPTPSKTAPATGQEKSSEQATQGSAKAGSSAQAKPAAQAAPQARPKPAAKAKADDAYRPPVSEPISN